jgi:hypothetical protein
MNHGKPDYSVQALKNQTTQRLPSVSDDEAL